MFREVLSIHPSGRGEQWAECKDFQQEGRGVRGPPHRHGAQGQRWEPHRRRGHTSRLGPWHSCPGHCSRLAAMPGHLVRNKGPGQAGETCSRMASKKTGVAHSRAHSSGFLPECFQALSNHSPRHSVPETAAGEVEVQGVAQRGNQTWPGQCCPIR